MKFRASLPYILATLLLASMFGSAQPTLATTTITVNSTDDEADYNFGVGTCSSLQNDTKCTLRAAIQTANQTVGADTIIVPAGTYVLTILAPSGAPGSVSAQNIANGDLDVLESVTIQGADEATTIIQGGPSFNDRIFDIAAPTQGTNAVTISNVTIQGGVLTGDSGAGISNDGTLTLSNVTVDTNSAQLDISSPPRGGDGGGIRNLASLTAINSTFSNNRAGDDGGAIYSTGTLNIVNSVFATNTGGQGSVNGAGGALDNTGTGRITGTLFDTNTTAGSGGAIANTGTLVVEQSLLDSNRTTGTTSDGGGVYNLSGNLTIANSTLTGNVAKRNGGGIASATSVGGPVPQVTITNTTLAYNFAGDNQPGNGENVRIAAGNVTFRNTLLDLLATSAGRNCSVDPAATVTSAGHNLEGVNFSGVPTNSSCGLSPANNDLIAQEARLAPALADNGGPTQTFALLNTSPAIDAATNCPIVDQRGYNRPADGNGDGTVLCDIGAFEVNAVLRPNHVYIPLVIKN